MAAYGEKYAENISVKRQNIEMAGYGMKIKAQQKTSINDEACMQRETQQPVSAAKERKAARSIAASARYRAKALGMAGAVRQAWYQ
jgi:hypothetical protein